MTDGLFSDEYHSVTEITFVWADIRLLVAKITNIAEITFKVAVIVLQWPKSVCLWPRAPLWWMICLSK